MATLPFDLLTMSLNEPEFFIKLRPNKLELKRSMIGRLVSFDEHLNLMLTDAEEYITLKGDNQNALKKVKHSMVFVRGDQVEMVSPSKHR